MQASIEGEDDDGCGVKIVDNNGVEHWIELKYGSRSISYHECDRYPNNPAKRTDEQTENGKQSKRFAQWHVYRERGYDVVPPTENPDRLLAGLLAITMLSDSEFEDYFGALERRLQRHYDDSPVDLPFPGADPDDAIVYQQDVYLQPDPTAFEPPVLDQFLSRFQGDSDSVAVAATETIQAAQQDALTLDIEAVSGIHVLHNDGQGNQQVARGDQPTDREPDVRLELVAFDPAEADSFQHYLVSHLAYQIRDRFLLMGVKPPVAFRAQGWGTYEGFQCQRFCSLYDEYWSPSKHIDSWEPA